MSPQFKVRNHQRLLQPLHQSLGEHRVAGCTLRGLWLQRRLQFVQRYVGLCQRLGQHAIGVLQQRQQQVLHQHFATAPGDTTFSRAFQVAAGLRRQCPYQLLQVYIHHNHQSLMRIASQRDHTIRPLMPQPTGPSQATHIAFADMQRADLPFGEHQAHVIFQRCARG